MFDVNPLWRILTNLALRLRACAVAALREVVSGSA